MFLAQNLNWFFTFHIKRYIKGRANIKHKVQKHFIFEYQTHHFINAYT